MTQNLRSVLSTLLFLLPVAACVGPHTHHPVPGTEEQSRIALNKMLVSELAVDGASLDHSSTMLAGQVLLRNKTNHKVRVRYHFTWFDGSGGQVGVSDGSSREITVLPYETRTLRGTAPLPAAVDYKIHIQRR